MRTTIDKNGKHIQVMDRVFVPEPDPNKNDVHTAPFIGTVYYIFKNGNVFIQDEKGLQYEFESNRVELKES